ncbi:hypothetical protein HPB48_021758 [Haemaphysalis longicornis]|uniref:Retrotransposon gag domain-containing protein n=1 Tax=Haemaphysalis longicornis TaxID=44386 RepID=A0A9J6FXV6_HAELO|nr:hypothetical protein HPB48_021758 [Haemaphysalis longicornis]
MTSWESFKEGLRRAFPNRFRRERAEELLRTHAQGPTESVTSFVEDVLQLSTRADPLATEETKLFYVVARFFHHRYVVTPLVQARHYRSETGQAFLLEFPARHQSGRISDDDLKQDRAPC